MAALLSLFRHATRAAPVAPDAELLAPGALSEHIAKVGFAGVWDQEVIPTITRMIAATKPG